MGLDMYLERCSEDEGIIKLEEVMYWRKAYIVMDWFIAHFRNIDNCARYLLDIDELVELQEFCDKNIKSDLNDLDSINLEWADVSSINDREYEMQWLKKTNRRLKKLIDEHKKNGYGYKVSYMFMAWW